MSRKEIVLKVQEGPAINYIKALHQVFGGKQTSTSYKLCNNSSDILCQSVKIMDDMELIITEARHNEHVVIKRAPEDDPNFIHITLFKQGQIPQSHPNRKQLIEANTIIGAYMHNGLFPLESHVPANMLIKTIAYKTSKTTLLNLLPEAENLFKTLFGAEEPVAYHLPLSIELERLTDDIFYFDEIKYGRTALIKARAFETLCSFFILAEQLVKDGDLKGLHRDDYKKLLIIKDKLLSSFNQKITIKGIADEFGFSVSKLKRDFKTLFDCSIYQFYTHAKMDEAYRMIKVGNQTIMQIGYDLGYSNISKFSEMFKKVKGMLPNEVSRLNLA